MRETTDRSIVSACTSSCVYGRRMLFQILQKLAGAVCSVFLVLMGEWSDVLGTRDKEQNVKVNEE